jgi:dihydropteroate synthase
MIYKELIQPQKNLNGTTVLNTVALTKANILRVHDVKEAVEVCNCGIK